MFVIKVRVCSECSRSRLAQFLKNGVPMAIGMSFLETSVTQRSDIMDRLIRERQLDVVEISKLFLN